jgi:hypothetical protein
VYVRAVRRSNWERLAAGEAAAINLCAAELTRGGTLVSVYECGSEASLELVAVAISATRQRQPFHYIQVGRGDLDAADVAVVATEGKTPLPSVNRLHRDLNLSGGRALALVARLAERRIAVAVISEAQLREFARSLLDDACEKGDEKGDGPQS